MCSWLLTVCLAACGRAGATTPAHVEAVRFVVVTPSVESSADFSGVDLGSAIESSFEADTSIEVDAIAPPDDPECSERVSCLREIGRERGASFVATCTVVTLGETALLRIRVVPVDESGTEQVRQTVLESATPETIHASVAAMARELAAPFVAPPQNRPRSRRFRWLGPLIGVAAAGAAAGTYAIVRTRDPDPDVVITPP